MSQSADGVRASEVERLMPDSKELGAPSGRGVRIAAPAYRRKCPRRVSVLQDHAGARIQDQLACPLTVEIEHAFDRAGLGIRGFTATWEKCLLLEGSSRQPSEICALNYIPPTRLLEHRSHYERCHQQDYPEKAGVLKMRYRVGVFCAQRFAELAGKNRPDHCSHSKRQEIDR